MCQQYCYCKSPTFLFCDPEPQRELRIQKSATDDALARLGYCRAKCSCEGSKLAEKDAASGSQPRSTNLKSSPNVRLLTKAVGARIDSDSAQPFGKAPWKRSTIENSISSSSTTLSPTLSHSSSGSSSLSSYDLSQNLERRGINFSKGYPSVRKTYPSIHAAARPRANGLGANSPRAMGYTDSIDSGAFGRKHRTICVGPKQELCQNNCRCSAKSELICDRQGVQPKQRSSLAGFFSKSSQTDYATVASAVDLVASCSEFCGCKDPAGTMRIQGLTVQDATAKYAPPSQRAGSIRPQSPYSSNRGPSQPALYSLPGPPPVALSVKKWMDAALLANAPGSAVDGDPKGGLRKTPQPIPEWIEDAKGVQAPGLNLGETGITYDIKRPQSGISQNIASSSFLPPGPDKDFDVGGPSVRPWLSEVSSEGSESSSDTPPEPEAKPQRDSSQRRSTHGPSDADKRFATPSPGSSYPQRVSSSFKTKRGPTDLKATTNELQRRGSDFSAPALTLSNNRGGDQGTPASILTCSNRTGSKAFCEARCYCTAAETVLCGGRSDSGTGAFPQNAEYSTESCPSTCWCGADGVSTRKHGRDGWGTWKLPGGGKRLREDDARNQGPRKEKPDYIFRPPPGRQILAPAYQGPSLSGPKLLPRHDKNSQAKPKTLFLHEVTELVPRFQLQPRGNGGSRSQTGYLPPKPFEIKCPHSLSRICPTYCHCDDGILQCEQTPHTSPYSSKSMGSLGSPTSHFRVNVDLGLCFRDCGCMDKRPKGRLGNTAAKRESWVIL
jgi:hypothetical protein